MEFYFPKAAQAPKTIANTAPSQVAQDPKPRPRPASSNTKSPPTAATHPAHIAAIF